MDVQFSPFRHGFMTFRKISRMQSLSNLHKHKINFADKYYSRSLPLAFDDCVDACIFLSSPSARNVDIGLVHRAYVGTTWTGECTAVRYNLTSSTCELIGTCSRHEDLYVKTGG